MSLFGKDIKSMENLFTHTLQDIYYAERQILKALPEMAQKASNPQLKSAFTSHLEETKSHVKRLEDVFRMQGQDPKGVECPAIDGIIEEANDVAGDVDDKQVLAPAFLGRCAMDWRDPVGTLLDLPWLGDLPGFSLGHTRHPLRATAEAAV